MIINQGQSNSWNLIWEPYLGFTVATYNIYRGSSQSTMSLLSSLSGYSYQFSDYNPPLGYVYYQIEVVAPESQLNKISTNLKSQKAELVSNNILSKSNIATNNVSEISDESNSQFLVFPNPAKGKLNIRLMDNTPSFVNIYSMVGILVYSNYFSEKNNCVDISDFHNDIYIIEVISGDRISKQKMVVNN